MFSCSARKTQSSKNYQKVMLLPLVKQPKIFFLLNQYGEHHGIHAKTQELSKCFQLLSDLCILVLLLVGNVGCAIQDTVWPHL